MENKTPTRFIPVLQVHENELFKTCKFKPRKYVGDPINAVRIFNLKCVDELLVVDIDATQSGKINFPLIEKMAAQCFTPLSYGGGISNLLQVDRLFQIGVDKVLIGSACFTHPDLVREVSTKFGNQAVIVSIDLYQNWLSSMQYLTYLGGKTLYKKEEPLSFAKRMVDQGAGEILLQNVNRDGTYQGMDQDRIKEFSQKLDVPLIACTGASDWGDLKMAIDNGATAVASGSQFTFYGPYQAVLQAYPNHWGDYEF